MLPPDLDLSCPFETLDGLSLDDVQATAYELLFTSCRSSPGFGGRNAIQFYSSDASNGENGVGPPAKGDPGGGTGVASRIKRALGLKMHKRSHSSRRSNSCGNNPLSPAISSPGIGFSTVPGGRSTRPLTSAEIMKQQMKVSEACDNRLRKTLMRTLVGQVDELLELMKKTWITLGFNKSMHDLCFTWVLFQQYVLTDQVENDLLCASFTMLSEVANGSKKVYREAVYMEMLSQVLTSMTKWCEKRLMNYHHSFSKGKIEVMEHILPLVFTATRILEENVPGYGTKGDATAGNKVDQYTRSSLKNAFAKMVGDGKVISRKTPFEQVCDALVRLANETEDLAFEEKRSFSMALKKWHPVSVGVAAVTLHSCYGSLLKQFLKLNTDINNEMLTVLQRADKLEKILVNMVVEDSVDCDDGGMTVVREMVLYEVDSIIVKFLGQSVTGRLEKIKDVFHKAKESETWNPKSKTEPYSQSAAELLKQSRELMVSFFDIPISISEDLVCEFVDGTENILRDYATFVASCGSKQNYIPTLPPLTRCSRGSKFIKLWKKATPCAAAGMSPYHLGLEDEANNSRPLTSRGTQRLYIRLNTLHYIVSQLKSLEKCLSQYASKIVPSQKNKSAKRRQLHFEHTRTTVMAATQHVTEVAAYRLIFLDSNSVLYGSLYVGHVVNARISPALRVLKQNLTLLSAIVTERAQHLSIKEVMKAAFEAYLMVLIAGGSGRGFTKADHEMIEDDLRHLKRVFASNEGVLTEDEVEKEAATVEGVVKLMGEPTEQLIEEFTVAACEASGMGVSSGQTLPMPPTTGRWSSSDANTMLRVLCHRKDRVANQFLKTTFHLAKR